MNEAFDARVMLDECLKRYENLVKDKKITVRTEAQAKVSTLGDRAKSARIVQNLLHNAIKFTPEGGSITLRLGEAADQGMLSTIPLQARCGLALRYGPRSIGHQDPGATSCYLILDALATAWEQRRS